MKLFENEIINISKIHTVAKYDFGDNFPAGTIRNYNVTLPTYELIFFLEGESVTHFSGVKINDCESSIRYLPKGITDGEYHVTKLVPTVCIDIYFDTADPMPKSAIGFRNMHGLKSLFIKLYNVWQEKKSGYYAEAMSILYTIIAEFRKTNSEYSPRTYTSKLSRSHDYMLSHYCEPDFDYKSMCAASGLSYDYFKELFKNAYGMPPVKYLTALRIERAKELLITGRFSISEIAEACGFENVYYFSTVFKKETGLPPSRYLSKELL